MGCDPHASREADEGRELVKRGRMQLTPAQLEHWRRVHAEYPGWKKRWDLVAQYAK